MLDIKKIALGAYSTNTYLLTDPESGEAAVIDPAVWDKALEAFLRAEGITSLKYVLLTHGHFDHICGVYALQKQYSARVLIHSEDAVCLENKDASLTSAVSGYEQTETKADEILCDGDVISLGKNEIRVMHTPGHTKGSVIFIAEGCIFSGDTLFRCSMGRTDLPGGSTKAIFRSLREIGLIQGEYRIFPGHGEETSLSYEKRNNRYLRANDTSHN